MRRRGALRRQAVRCDGRGRCGLITPQQVLKRPRPDSNQLAQIASALGMAHATQMKRGEQMNGPDALHEGESRAAA